jgi:hypothetical protein
MQDRVIHSALRYSENAEGLLLALYNLTFLGQPPTMRVPLREDWRWESIYRSWCVAKRLCHPDLQRHTGIAMLSAQLRISHAPNERTIRRTIKCPKHVCSHIT